MGLIVSLGGWLFLLGRGLLLQQILKGIPRRVGPASCGVGQYVTLAAQLSWQGFAVPELLQFIRLHMKASARRAKHFWARVWNNMKWLGPKTTAKGGKRRLWRQMASPTERDSGRGVCQRVSSSKREGRGSRLQRGETTRGYIHRPQRQRLQFSGVWRGETAEQPLSIKQNSTIMHVPKLLAWPWSARLAL